jgi:hypothetical protein
MGKKIQNCRKIGNYFFTGACTLIFLPRGGKVHIILAKVFYRVFSTFHLIFKGIWYNICNKTKKKVVVRHQATKNKRGSGLMFRSWAYPVRRGGSKLS